MSLVHLSLTLHVEDVQAEADRVGLAVEGLLGVVVGDDDDDRLSRRRGTCAKAGSAEGQASAAAAARTGAGRDGAVSLLMPELYRAWRATLQDATQCWNTVNGAPC